MSIITSLLSSKNFIITNKVLSRNIGLYEALVFSELCGKHEYFLSQNKLTIDGFFYCTAADLEYHTTLTKSQQVPVIKHLQELGFVETKLKGIPARRHFRIGKTQEKAFLKAMDKFARGEKSLLSQV